MKKRKILVTGLSGVVGRSLLPSIVGRNEVVAIVRAPLAVNGVRDKVCELTDTKELTKILQLEKPDVILHLAASTHIDVCEEDRVNGVDGIVWKTNVGSTRELAGFAAATSTPVVMLSTECVFDGEKETYAENDQPNPKNWYGETKFLAEQSLLDSGAPVSILRSVIALGQSGGKTILEKMLNQLKKGESFKVVSDQRISPTHLPRIIKVVSILLDKPRPGIFHIAPEDWVTPAELATLLARQLGIDPHIIQPISMEAFFGAKRAKLRLKNSCLSSRKTLRALGLRPHTIKGVLQTLDLSEF